MKEQRLETKANGEGIHRRKQEDFEGLTKEGGGHESVAHCL